MIAVSERTVRIPRFCRLKAFFTVFVLFVSFSRAFAQSSDSNVTTIKINNANQTSYQKDPDTKNDIIVLKGLVSLSVEKGSTVSDIKADSVTFDRKTQMLYAEGNVEITTKSSASGGETTTANSLLMNTSTLEGVFDNARVVQTQSDALNLPSGSTLIVFADFFGKSSQNTIVFKNSSLTFCDDENPHWHIDATRTWLLPGGEFAFFNALLYVGSVPVMYFPAFYYPKEELVFNPVFGYQKREGFSIQTTTYIIGRKPLDTSTTSSSSTSSSSTEDDSSSASESLKGVYNFVKPSKLKNQELEGLVLHNLDSDFTGDTSKYLKFMADWYSTLGGMTGFEGKFTPSDVITQLDITALLGFSNVVFMAPNGNYFAYSQQTGEKYYDTSNFLGVYMPFRYLMDFKMTVAKPLKLDIALPVYSDPFFAWDFKTSRKESMDWIGYLIEMASNDFEDRTVSESSSFSWTVTGSYSPLIPDFLKPYISTASVTFNSSVLFSIANVKDRNEAFSSADSSDRGDLMLYSPERKFYYPSQVTPLSTTVSFSGTLFEYPLTTARKNGTSPVYAIALNKPDDIKENKETSGESNESSSAKQDDEEKITPTLPLLDYSSPEFVLPTGFAYKLGYNFSSTFSNQISYSPNDLNKSSDFSWNNVNLYMYNVKMPVSVTSDTSYGGNFFNLKNSINYNPVWQEHPYISDEANKKSIKLSDYKTESQTITNVNAVTLRPLSYIDLFSESSVQWDSSIKLFRREFIGTADEPSWKYKGVDWDDEECITVNSLTATLVLAELDKKFKQSLAFAAIMPPILRQYTGTLTLTFPYVVTSVTTGLQETTKDTNVSESDRWKKKPLTENLSVNLFDSTFQFTQSFSYNLQDDYAENLKFGLNYNGLSATYIMAYSPLYDFDKTTGWKSNGDHDFVPYSLELGYAPAKKTYYKWLNRISISPGINTKLVYDFVRPTNSYFTITPALTFKINNFFDLTLSFTTKNSVIYRYFQSALGHDGRLPGEQNMFVDLFNSFRFDDQAMRESSGFKLKSFNLTLSHDLHDWKFNLTAKFEPRLLTVNGKKQYDLKPYITIGIVWNPLPSMRTQIVDNYGTWQLKN